MKLKKSSICTNFNLSDGYWQLHLSTDALVCQRFVTPDGILSPTRVLHGTQKWLNTFTIGSRLGIGYRLTRSSTRLFRCPTDI